MMRIKYLLFAAVFAVVLSMPHESKAGEALNAGDTGEPTEASGPDVENGDPEIAGQDVVNEDPAGISAQETDEISGEESAEVSGDDGEVEADTEVRGDMELSDEDADASDAVDESGEAAEPAEEEAGEEETADPAAVKLEMPLPITEFTASDTPNSAGDSITLQWTPAANEFEAGVEGYSILRSTSPDGPFEEVGTQTLGARSHRDSDARNIIPGKRFYYQIVTRASDDRIAESEIVSAKSEAQWFHMGRWVMLMITVLLSAAILFNIFRARRGTDLYVRRIAGLESVEEAIGRSTEMGKPVLYIPGIRDMDDIQTIASMSILSHVAKLTAEYDTPILVPNIRAVVMSTAQEVVKQAYLDAGRPDAYNSENIRYLTDDQFGYTAGVDGIMMRDKPAANFFLGCFFAESLILAETGASTGAIQVAGTAQPSQLPFFVAACDYTLIGEELFAASAYLAREPMLLGSLKGQDWGKLVFMIAILLGAIGSTVVSVGGLEPDVWWNIASWWRVE